MNSRLRTAPVSLLLVAALVLLAPTVHAGPGHNARARGLLRSKVRRARARGRKVIFVGVLNHGFNASPDSDWGWGKKAVEIAKKRWGADRVIETQVTPFGQPFGDRGAQLKKQMEHKRSEILAKNPGALVLFHLWSHSQGGLDASWLASPDGGKMGGSIASISTFSTPHLGTNVAKALAPVLDGKGIAKNTERLIRKAGDALLTRQLNPKAASFAHDLHAALQSMNPLKIGKGEFHERYRPSSEVQYYSWGGLSNVGGIAGPHDGPVSNVDAAGQPLKAAWQTPTKVREPYLRGLPRKGWYGNWHFWNPLFHVRSAYRRLRRRPVRHTMSGDLAAVAPLVSGLQLTPGDAIVTVASAKGPADGPLEYRGTWMADHKAIAAQGRGGGKSTTHDPVRQFEKVVGGDMALIEAHALGKSERTVTEHGLGAFEGVKLPGQK